MKAAIYSRYSTELQSEASIADQERVCERIAERHGLTVAARFSDAAISGGTTQRPGYQRLLAAARRLEFEVIVAEDTSRLWRNLAEQSPRLAELADLGIAVVTHDLDTRHESAEIMGAVGGAMASAYRKEIGRRTRRGLEGLARKGKSAGGRAFGYVPPAMSGTGQIEIDSEQAKIVRRIFKMFADGHSPRSIADTLNREKVPAPGATWGRESRRKQGWVGSAIHGNPARGLGILNNETYRGAVIWNRSRWIRSAADSSKRRQVQNPRKEWVMRQDERLRIVSDELWERARARQAEQAHRIGVRVKAGMSKVSAKSTGPGPKFLLSALLKCERCGSAYVICGVDRYACGGHINGGNSLCTNNATLRRHVAEKEVLAGIKRGMSDPLVLAEISRRVRAEMRRPAPKVADGSARVSQLQAEVENMADAIAQGMLRASPALAARLMAAEDELLHLQAARPAQPLPVASIERLLANLPVRAKQSVEHLEETLASGDVTRAREEIRGHVGSVSVDADEREIRLWSDKGEFAAVLLRATGTHTSNCGSGGRI